MHARGVAASCVPVQMNGAARLRRSSYKSLITVQVRWTPVLRRLSVRREKKGAAHLSCYENEDQKKGAARLRRYDDLVSQANQYVKTSQCGCGKVDGSSMTKCLSGAIGEAKLAHVYYTRWTPRHTCKPQGICMLHALDPKACAFADIASCIFHLDDRCRWTPSPFQLDPVLEAKLSRLRGLPRPLETGCVFCALAFQRDPWCAFTYASAMVYIYIRISHGVHSRTHQPWCAFTYASAIVCIHVRISHGVYSRTHQP
eukprot:1137464-Pelagomonas_calceolata.AAC.3